MKLIDDVIEKINYLGDTKAGVLLAQALYSACCHDDFPAPSLLTLSSALDASNKELVCELIHITSQPDYSNADQARARQFVEQRFGNHIASWRCGLMVA